jgi:diguanylate cyclase (GGDEF)-like protein
MAGGAFRTALAGVLLGAALLLFPNTREYSAVAGVYFTWTLANLFLIRRGAWPTVRVPVGGIVDYAVVTILVHDLGSVRTAMVLLYFVSGTLYALAAPFRTAVALGGLGSLLYISVVAAERSGLLPFAPLSPDIAALGQPPAGLLAFGVCLGAILHFVLVGVVASLVREVQVRGESLAEANERLQELSERDPLTGLYNRRFLLAQLERELARAKRGANVSLLMMDLDHFKRVNDLQGHLRGDLLLQQLAQELKAAVRVTDVAARYGGDEIVALLPDTSRQEARVVAERLLTGIRRVGSNFDAVHPVTASIGHAVARVDDVGASLLSRADANTYAAKRSGGNAVVMDGDEAPVSRERITGTG